MNALRLPLTLCAALAAFTACGGSQSPIGAPGTMPQSRAIAQHAAHSNSWMLPEASGEDLLYVSDGSAVFVYLYPQLKPVGKLTGFHAARGMCTDSLGNVFITEPGDPSTTIYEYAHGGTEPIATLTDPGGAISCSLDPVSGDLAVANEVGASRSSPGNLAVFKGAKGEPKTYSDSEITAFLWCAYDGAGSLFADPYPGSDEPSGTLAELPVGKNSLTHIALSKDFRPLSLQGNGNSIIAAGLRQSRRQTTPVYEITVSGSTGRVAQPILLNARKNWEPKIEQFWVQGNTTIGGGFNHQFRYINFWKVPQGGKPVKSAPKGYGGHFGVVVSVAKSR
ncbi:MAG TPA: hypothetical protein VHR97_04315 [Candidatus Baltobacteraceae bacterium]|jgi:hypothetical protein|nr:hypothetical protein [Candidatus Baltobacteraceae bacterium]